MPNRTRSHLALALALICALLALPAAASAATGTLRGTVTGANGGGPVPNPSVCIEHADSSFADNCVTGSSNGEYSFVNVEAEEYLVQFEGTGEYLGQWYDQVETKAEATPVTVTAGGTAGGIDAELPLGSAIEGTVTDAESGADLAGIRVCANLADGNPIFSRCGTTSASGHYRAAGLPAGEYKVRLEPEPGQADPDYLHEYLPGVHFFAEGSVVQVGAAATLTGLDATMQLGGEVSGKVVNEAGNPIESLSVCLYVVPGAGSLAGCYENVAQTGADGTYTLKGVWSGEYKVHFGIGVGAQNYIGGWYGGEPTRATAQVITVTAPNATTGIDATLQSGGVISGTLLEAGTEAPVGYASVCAAAAAGNGSTSCAQTKADGSYRIESLPSGNYTVEFVSSIVRSNSPYVSSFYGGATQAEAIAIGLTAGTEAVDIDGEVAKGGTISGLVTDAVTDEPAAGIDACAYSGGAVVGVCDTTHQTGEYTIIGLPSGSYSVRFVPAAGSPFDDYLIGNPDYLNQFYEDAESEGDATPVASGPGIAKTGIDVEMHEGGGIAGTVTGPLGESLTEAEVCIVVTAEELGGHCGRTNGAGEYTIGGLYPGSYVVYFRSGGSAQPETAGQYSGGVPRFSEATPVTVSGTAVTTGVDASLVAGGKIEGTVTDSFDGAPLSGISVCAETTDGPIGNCVESEAGGHYAMPVAPGTYKVKFSLGYWEREDGAEKFFEEFGTQFFDGATSAGAANVVTVSSGATITGVDASMDAVGVRANSVSVSKGGSGAGAVVSSPAGIDCGATCSDEFETRKTVTLHAEPTAGSTFSGWTGACSGTGPCQVRLTAATSVGATFESSGEPGQSQTTTPLSTGTVVTPPPTGSKTVKPKPKKKTCPAGKKLKKLGKGEICVKKPKKHQRKHRAKRH